MKQLTTFLVGGWWSCGHGRAWRHSLVAWVGRLLRCVGIYHNWKKSKIYFSLKMSLKTTGKKLPSYLIFSKNPTLKMTDCCYIVHASDCFLFPKLIPNIPSYQLRRCLAHKISQNRQYMSIRSKTHFKQETTGYYADLITVSLFVTVTNLLICLSVGLFRHFM